MKRCLLAFLLLAAPVAAQPATPASKLAFDLVGQSVATASSATYVATIDNASAGVTLTGVTCTPLAGPGIASATCTANFPALTPGAHTLTVLQTIGGASSAQSTSFAFSYVIVVTPTNVRLVP